MKKNMIKMPSDTGAFLEIRCGNGKLLFGGDQAMFSKEEYRRLGCGTISCANILLYCSACGRYDFSPRGKFSFSEREYMTFAEKLNEKIPPDVNGLRLASVYRKLTGDRMNYRPLFCTPRERLFETMKHSLLNDMPLIISIYNHKGHEIQPFGGGNAKAENVRAHYMTVTGLSETPERKIIVSSWGRRYIFDFDAYYTANRRILLKGIGNGIGSGIFEITPKMP